MTINGLSPGYRWHLAPDRATITRGSFRTKFLEKRYVGNFVTFGDRTIELSVGRLDRCKEQRSSMSSSKIQASVELKFVVVKELS